MVKITKKELMQLVDRGLVQQVSISDGQVVSLVFFAQESVKMDQTPPISPEKTPKKAQKAEEEMSMVRVAEDAFEMGRQEVINGMPEKMRADYLEQEQQRLLYHSS